MRGRARLPSVRALTAAIACWGIGCAAAAVNAPATEYRASDAQLFEGAVDLVETPVIIESEWGGTFERRVGRADLIAVVRVQSLTSDFIKRRTTYRLHVKVRRRLKGESTKELVLKVTDEEPGFESVRVHEDRILENQLVAFIKWEADPASPELIAHWHLSPDSDAVRDKVEFFLRQPARDSHTEVEVVQD